MAYFVQQHNLTLLKSNFIFRFVTELTAEKQERVGMNKYFNSGATTTQNEYSVYFTEACIDFEDERESIS
jgi:hypothetical protein